MSIEINRGNVKSEEKKVGKKIKKRGRGRKREQKGLKILKKKVKEKEFKK